MDELRRRLPTVEGLADAREAPAWRAGDFARFEVGRLPDGREELLEFWLRNHLLPDFAALKARAEVGAYGGGEVAFLSLADLIRSKETSRESDWQDVTLLEEVQDARLLATDLRAPDGARRALAHLRSRRGFERGARTGLFDDARAVSQAMATCAHPVTFAFLFPLSPAVAACAPAGLLDPTVLAALRSVTFNSTKHVALVEVVRRAYKRNAMDLDRADKQAKLGEPGRGRPPGSATGASSTFEP